MYINELRPCRSTPVQNLSVIDDHMKTNVAISLALAASLTCGLAQPAFAGKGSAWSYGRTSYTQMAASAVPLSQVLAAINAQEPGTQLDTNTVVENGRTIYIVRWQAARGRIIIFRVDAETGQIIGRQG
jgi:uncharacterized membrane protein YkoI